MGVLEFDGLQERRTYEFYAFYEVSGKMVKFKRSSLRFTEKSIDESMFPAF